MTRVSSCVAVALAIGILSCDRVCGSDCFGAIDGSSVSPPDASEAPDTTLDGPVDASADESAPEDADAGSGQCPTNFVVAAYAQMSPDEGELPGSIALGPDAALWFAATPTGLHSGYGRAEVENDGAANFTFIPYYDDSGLPQAVAKGPDQAMWYTLENAPQELVRVADDTAAPYSLIDDPAKSRHGLVADTAGNLWSAEQRVGNPWYLAWNTIDGGSEAGAQVHVIPMIPMGSPLVSVEGLAADDAGFVWYTGTSVQGRPGFGRAAADGSFDFGLLALPSDGGADATPGPIVATQDNTVWFLVPDPTAPGQGGWIVHAMASDAAVAFPSTGTPIGIAVWDGLCGVLVTHDGGITLVSPDGSPSELATDASPFTPSGPIARGPDWVAVVTSNPRGIEFLRLH